MERTQRRDKIIEFFNKYHIFPVDNTNLVRFRPHRTQEFSKKQCEYGKNLI